ncbi:hypothetical protein JCGZ_07664 [Jatropha curcas]|uniref:LOB domain-containing protein n=1 Tax=Jatropha curcas TaxID=180498 RepID=A0A067KGF7_JATCU|nr:LOB domain-containing protein 27 isoform X1 [Jatropha curcas]KDP34093.1 hypothetical protein JCGZ_07664 [Jatropha curcas]
MNTAVSQACAACKFQRRKCTPDCLLAPHFPSNRQQDFLNAHKLFGVKNILKTLKDLNSFEIRKAAARSIIFHSNARASDPVGGCYRIISNLKTQILYLQQELNLVKQQIAFHQQLSNPPPPTPPPLNVYDPALAVQSMHDSDVYDASDTDTKIESEVLSSFDLSGHLSVDAKAQPFAVDVSEDVKPFVHGFDERDNTVFLDSSKEVTINRSEKMVEPKGNDKPIQDDQQEHNIQNASEVQSTRTNGKNIDLSFVMMLFTV